MHKRVSPHARWLTPILWVGLLTLCVASCGSSAARATSTTSPSSSTTRVDPTGSFLLPEIKYGTGQAGAPSPTTTVPVERGRRPINPANDAGQQVIIAKGGYLLPAWLVAEVTLPITWTNLSGAPQQIVFDDAPMHSPVIGPGGTFTWKSPGYPISLTYHIINGHGARLTLQNPNAP